VASFVVGRGVTAERKKDFVSVGREGDAGENRAGVQVFGDDEDFAGAEIDAVERGFAVGMEGKVIKRVIVWGEGHGSDFAVDAVLLVFAVNSNENAAGGIGHVEVSDGGAVRGADGKGVVRESGEIGSGATDEDTGFGAARAVANEISRAAEAGNVDAIEIASKGFGIFAAGGKREEMGVSEAAREEGFCGVGGELEVVEWAFKPFVDGAVEDEGVWGGLWEEEKEGGEEAEHEVILRREENVHHIEVCGRTMRASAGAVNFVAAGLVGGTLAGWQA